MAGRRPIRVEAIDVTTVPGECAFVRRANPGVVRTVDEWQQR